MELKTFLEAIRREVMRVLQHYGEEQSCIATSALLAHVLRKTGFPEAHPLTVRVTIYTAQTYEWIKRHGIPKNEADWERFTKAGCVHAYIGYTPTQMLPENHWPGHLAVVVPNLFGDRHGLADFSIVQANRPELGIRLTPLLLEVPREFLIGTVRASTKIQDCYLFYEAFPGDTTFNEQGHWEQSATIRVLASQIFEHLDAKGVIPSVHDLKS